MREQTLYSLPNTEESDTSSKDWWNVNTQQWNCACLVVRVHKSPRIAKSYCEQRAMGSQFWNRCNQLVFFSKVYNEPVSTHTIEAENLLDLCAAMSHAEVYFCWESITIPSLSHLNRNYDYLFLR